MKIYKFEGFEFPNNLVDYKIVKNGKIENRIIKNDNELQK